MLKDTKVVLKGINNNNKTNIYGLEAKIGLYFGRKLKKNRSVNCHI